MSEQSYQKRMHKKNAHINHKVAEANVDRGIIVLLTGNGKGKSSSAFGMVCRSLGHNKKIGIGKFLKGEIASGEDLLFSKFGNIQTVGVKTQFTWQTQDKAHDIKVATETWQQIKPFLQNTEIDLVVLDELTYMLNYQYLDEAEVITTLKSRPKFQHVIITGRAASQKLCDIADTVSEVKNVKHAFMNNIKAQIGIEL